jgi:predicted PurR-regulated permease PerM
MPQLDQKEYLKQILKEKILDAKLERHDLDIGNLNSSFNELEKDLKKEMHKKMWEILIFVGVAFVLFIGGIFIEVFLFHMNNYREYISKFEEIKANNSLLETKNNSLMENIDNFKNKIDNNINAINARQDAAELQIRQLEDNIKNIGNLTKPAK